MAPSLARIIAAEPSFTPLALPAVTVPFSRKGVGSLASCSNVVCGRGCSSASTTTGSPFRCGIVTGSISAANRPLSMAAPAFCWDRRANLSWSSRLTCQRSATFSPVSGMESVPYIASSVGSRTASRWWCRRFPLSVKRGIGLRHHKGCAAHAFRAAGYHKFAFSALDHARGRNHRFHSRGTEPIERNAGHGLRQSGQQQATRDVRGYPPGWFAAP